MNLTTRNSPQHKEAKISITFSRRPGGDKRIEMKKTLIPIITALLAVSIPISSGAQKPDAPATKAATTVPAPQTAKQLPLPATGYEKRLEKRNEFSSHTSRANSDSGDRQADWNYIYIKDFKTAEADGTKTYSAQLEIPDYWADRIIIMHTEGGRNSHRAYVNGVSVGASRDSGTPSEFNISTLLRKGTNTLSIEVPDDTPEPESGLTTKRTDIETWFLYSQPRTRIVDYRVGADINKSGDGELFVDVVVENDFRTEEKFNVGFDIFSPEGRLEEYGIKNLTMSGVSRDTLPFKAVIYGAGKKTWSAEKPDTYHLTLFIGDNGRVLEYIPINVGFGKTKFSDGNVYRNDKKVAIKHKTYNASTPDKLRKDIARFKKEGFNTILPDYPQPYWFYDICDRSGMYVIDQANINSSYGRDDMRIGGTPSNSPEWLPEYMERTKAMYYRSHNHPCIIAWSLGGDSGNGYNLYKTYLWLKETDPSRAVIYRSANGDWNNDITLK